MTDPLLEVRSLCKYFPVRSKGLIRRQIGVVKAVDEVSFTLHRGETIGLVGESGSGKTTTARSILRAINPTSGQVLLHGQNGEPPVDLASLDASSLKRLRPRMQMVFQDPYASLNPRMRVAEIIAEGLIIHGLTQGAALRQRVDEVLTRVGLRPEHGERFPNAFSGGQRQRIGIARALIMRPDLLVADEAVSALDVSVQAQVLNLLADLRDELGLTCLFVAHDLSVVRHLCNRVAVMYAGRIVELAPTAELFANPRHPYTQALLAAVPHPDPDRRSEAPLAGDPADPARLPGGCSFHPRCSHCFEPCRSVTPRLRTTPDREIACHLNDPALPVIPTPATAAT